MKILIVEDNSGDLFFIEEFLHRTNLQIDDQQSARTMREAEELLTKEIFDVIFLDLFLPDVSGVTAFQRLNPKSISAAVIVLTGLLDENIALEALKHGVQDYLVKGEYDEKLLEKTVRYAVERKSTQELLKISEERYKILFEGNPIPMWAHDLETNRFVMVNNAAIAHYGYSAEEFSNMTIFDIRPPSERDRFMLHLKKIENEKQHLHNSAEWKHLKKDGTVINVEVISHIIPWGTTKIRLVAAYDITERTKTEDHLRLLESAITNANDSVLISEIGQNNIGYSPVIYINHAFTKMTGYHPDEIIGKTASILHGPASDLKELQRINDVMKKQESAEFEIANYTKDGEMFWNNFTLVPVADKSGIYTHWVSIQRDVTSRKQQEEITRKKLEKLINERTRELHEALAKEKDLVEMKSRFVSIASHEFRTPLSTINFATNFLQDHFQQLDAAEISSKLKKIEKQVIHMTSLLEDVILVGRNDLNKIQVIKTTIHLRSFIDKIIEDVSQTTKNTHIINLTYDVKTDHLVADEKLLRNIFINLLTNAIKFSPGRSEVDFKLKEKDDTLYLEVIDHGIGITKSDKEHLYEAFYRGSNTTTIAGSGLGLSIVKKAVELLKGEMELNSEETKGTQVKIKFPME